MKKIILFFLTLCCFTSFAQHDHDHGDANSQINHVMACRSGVNFVESLPVPKLMTGVGSSDLKIKTNSPLAQQYFSQGVSLLHCFWDLEAYRSFREAINLDSTAIMPYWGLVHTILFINNKDFDVEKSMAVDKLKELVEDAEGFEKLYAEGILDYVKSENRAGYEQHLEYIMHQYPDDIEAKLFLALFNMSGYNKDMNPRKGTKYSEYILRDLLKSYPDNHGVHHYWIHQMENCCPKEALASANKLAALAPASGHIVHMPGHIYYKLGYYKKAHDQFIDAMRADSSYMAEQNIAEVDNWNYIHNLNYLLANCAQNGRYKEGLMYAERLESMITIEERVDMHRGAFFYQGKITPPIMEMRFGFWDRAVEKFDKIIDLDTVYGRSALDYKTALTHFSKSMSSLEKDDSKDAQKYLDKLQALLWRNSQVEDKKDKISNYRIKVLKVATTEIEGNIMISNSEFDNGIKKLEEAVQMEKDLGYTEPPYYPRPTLLSLASAHLKNGDPNKAIECYDDMLELHPNSAVALWAMMKMYKASDDLDSYVATRLKFEEVIQYGDREAFR